MIRYLALISCFVSTLAATEVLTDNVVVVLDASGSMRELMGTQSRMDVAKEALHEVMKTVPETTHVGLLVFSGKQKERDWLQDLGPRDEAALRAAINAPVPGGKTPLGAYLRKGANRLLAQRQEQLGYGTYRLLIVTDGQASDRNLVQAYVPTIMRSGIVVDLIGVAMGQRHELAQRVHSYRAADNPESLRQALSEVFAEVGSSGDDATAEYDELAPIPFEMASEILQAVSSSSNEPIPENNLNGQPRAQVTPAPSPTAGNAAPGATPTASTVTVETKTSSASGFITAAVVVVAAFIALRIIKGR